MAVLVAIAIPVFTTRLEQSRETTDIANLRSAYAAGQVAALSGIESGSSTVFPSGTYEYNPNDGDGLAATGSGTPIGQGTATDGKADTTKLPTECTYSTGSDYRNSTIKLQFDASGLTSVHF